MCSAVDASGWGWWCLRGPGAGRQAPIRTHARACSWTCIAKKVHYTLGGPRKVSQGRTCPACGWATEDCVDLCVRRASSGPLSNIGMCRQGKRRADAPAPARPLAIATAPAPANEWHPCGVEVANGGEIPHQAGADGSGGMWMGTAAAHLHRRLRLQHAQAHSTGPSGGHTSLALRSSVSLCLSLSLQGNRPPNEYECVR